MLRRVAVVIRDASEERSSSIIRVTRTGTLGTTLMGAIFDLSVLRLLATTIVVPSPQTEAMHSTETSVLTIRRHSSVRTLYYKIRKVENSCECGNEPSFSIKYWDAIEWLHNWWPLKLCSAPYSQFRRWTKSRIHVIQSFEVWRLLGCYAVWLL
jgi:hypothetical protein